MHYWSWMRLTLLEFEETWDGGCGGGGFPFLCMSVLYRYWMNGRRSSLNVLHVTCENLTECVFDSSYRIFPGMKKIILTYIPDYSFHDSLRILLPLTLTIPALTPITTPSSTRVSPSTDHTYRPHPPETPSVETMTSWRNKRCWLSKDWPVILGTAGEEGTTAGSFVENQARLI